MALYWRLKSVPELKDLPAEERKRVWKQATKQAGEDDAFYGLNVVLQIIVVTHLLGSVALWGTLLPSEAPDIFLILPTAAVLIGAWIMGPLRPWTISIVREYVRQGPTEDADL